MQSLEWIVQELGEKMAKLLMEEDLD